MSSLRQRQAAQLDSIKAQFARQHSQSAVASLRSNLSSQQVSSHVSSLSPNVYAYSGMVCVIGRVWSPEREARDGGGGETAAECREGARRIAESADKAAVTTIGGG